MSIPPLTLARLTPPPSSRSFIVGSTGSGKSTLAARLVEEYHRLHRSHRIYLLDPKGRFHEQREKDEQRVFPWGVLPTTNHDRISVPVNARTLVERSRRFSHESDRVFLIQEPTTMLGLFHWLYAHPSAREPALVVADESFDFHRGGRADPSLRRLVQQGRELSCGLIIINQRPHWIDATLLSEANYLYVGMLFNDRDRLRMKEIANLPNARDLLTPLQEHTWWLLHQARPAMSVRFRLREG